MRVNGIAMPGNSIQDGGPEGLVLTEKLQLDSQVVKFPHAVSDLPPRQR